MLPIGKKERKTIIFITRGPKVNLDCTYVPSAEVVAREMDGVLIIVPLSFGICEMEDVLFTLNE